MSDDEITSTTDALNGVQSTQDASSPARGIYANSEKAAAEGLQMVSQRGDSSDEVDPRKLVRDPTLSEIRWYYRRTFAKKLVDKPVDDAFKNGFSFSGDNEEEAEELIYGPDFDGEGRGFEGAFKLADKKARRDGFALIFIGTRERGSAGMHETFIDDSVEVDDITHFKVLTVDDLTQTAPHEQIQEATGLDETQYETRKTGIVINTDVSSPDYRTPIGYVLDNTQPQFIHRDRVIHRVYNPEVDGDYNNNGVRRYEYGDGNSYLGQYEGDSVLMQSYDLLKGMSKGNWAIMQAVFRNASHMYSVYLPPDASEEDMKNVTQQTSNINAKSSLIYPTTEYEMEQHESGNEMEPREHFDVIFDQICASHEMTKSVLFGTQAGTVSGSESDIKNYFNKVERYQTDTAKPVFIEYLTRVKKALDNRTSTDFRYDVSMRFGPMFKVDAQTKIQMMQNGTQAMATAIGQYVLTPDEARSILSSEFTEIDLDDLTETQKDELDRIRLATSGQGEASERSEREYTEGPPSPSSAAAEGGRTGGREQGQVSGDESVGEPSDGVVEKLERLSELHDSELLTEDEYEAAKQEVLD